MSYKSERVEVIEAVLHKALDLRALYMAEWLRTESMEAKDALKQLAEVQYILMDLKTAEKSS